MLFMENLALLIEGQSLTETESMLSLDAKTIINNNFDTKDTLKSIAQFSNEYKTLQGYIEVIEDVLKRLNKDAETLGGYIIPELLSRAGVKSFELEDGAKVSCKETVFASLPKEDMLARERALQWLNEQGAGGLIKDQLVVESPNEELIEQVKGRFRIERKKDVNTNSLKSFMTELLGYKQNSVARVMLEEVPSELHVFVKNTTTIKQPK